VEKKKDRRKVKRRQDLIGHQEKQRPTKAIHSGGGKRVGGEGKVGILIRSNGILLTKGVQRKEKLRLLFLLGVSISKSRGREEKGNWGEGRKFSRVSMNKPYIIHR